MGGSEWKKEGQSGEWQLKMGSCQERRGQGAGGGGGYLCESEWMGHRTDEDLTQFPI